jgi:hypothetical protein
VAEAAIIRELAVVRPKVRDTWALARQFVRIELERLIKLKAQANPSPERQPGDGVLLASHLNPSEFTRLILHGRRVILTIHPTFSYLLRAAFFRRL